MSWPKEAFLHLRQILTPKGRPQNGGNLLYTKSDNELYLMDADGTEHAVGGAGGGTVDMVVAGSQITVDATDPANPIVATAGLVESVTAGTNVTVDNTDPLNPIVSASGGTETLPASIIDAKGDLIAGTAADTAARIAVGSDGQALVADSASTAGVKWSGVVGNLWSNTSSLALSTLTGWTAGAGTWAISSGVIRQSSTTSSQKRLHFDTRVPLSRLVVECEVKMDTAASATLSRVGVVIGTPPASDGANGDGVYLATSGSTAQIAVLHTERDAAVNWVDVTLASVITNGTWTTLRVVKSGRDFDVYINTALLCTIRGVDTYTTIQPPANLGRIALYSYASDVSFRNFKVWTPTLP